ncbi:GGDEF domain-containing protein [Solwaraspora sp. WMMD1047]|uniref:GGDEF domain-containing protein n=1 Tax=Solwaraspora sp. WMMD1047 TaxID=3016102 RepID=UPI0024163824|nr:GGDEF domain-containing protein [Solwaraspora sp. WMMD1047]MDG4830864.1 GGDEF domain-containing protein [Solwaraspora sp. WMMD1047]
MTTARTMPPAAETAAAVRHPDQARHGEPPPCHACGRPLTDPLTGLLDRGTWTARAGTAFERRAVAGEPVALVIVDLDCFKRINDTFGHPAGDAVLRAVADLLRDRVPEEALTGRYGGHADEFLVLLPGQGLPPALAVAETIRRGVRELSVRTSATRGSSVTITGRTASLGVAACLAGDRPGGRLPDLLLDADVALRTAKRGGRDRVCALPT